MTQKFANLGLLHAAIGKEAMQLVGGDSDRLFVYAEIEPGFVYAAVFKDEGSSVRYLRPSQALFDTLSDAWRAEDKDKRWATLEYDIWDGHFDAKFKFPDQIDRSSEVRDRRAAALRARYGNRKIVYPPIPDHFMRP